MQHVGAWARIRVWRLDGITRRQRVVLAALASYANREGRCWPGRGRLADMTDLSMSRVSQTVAELEKLGLLHVDRSRRLRWVNVYAIDAAVMRAFPEFPWVRSEVEHRYAGVPMSPSLKGTPAYPSQARGRTSVTRESGNRRRRIKPEEQEKTSTQGVGDAPAPSRPIIRLVRS